MWKMCFVFCFFLQALSCSSTGNSGAILDFILCLLQVRPEWGHRRMLQQQTSSGRGRGARRRRRRGQGGRGWTGDGDRGVNGNPKTSVKMFSFSFFLHAYVLSAGCQRRVWIVSLSLQVWIRSLKKRVHQWNHLWHQVSTHLQYFICVNVMVSESLWGLREYFAAVSVRYILFIIRAVCQYQYL